MSVLVCELFSLNIRVFVQRPPWLTLSLHTSWTLSCQHLLLSQIFHTNRKHWTKKNISHGFSTKLSEVVKSRPTCIKMSQLAPRHLNSFTLRLTSVRWQQVFFHKELEARCQKVENWQLLSHAFDAACSAYHQVKLQKVFQWKISVSWSHWSQGGKSEWALASTELHHLRQH